MTSSIEIFVQLLDEGVAVWRPVSARLFDDLTFEILGIVPVGETWEFEPGMRVRCEERFFAGSANKMVAIQRVLDE